MKTLIAFIIRVASTTGSNIRSNTQVFFVSVATIAIALSILGVFLVIFVNLNSFLSTWSGQVQLIIYLNDDLTQSQLHQIEQTARQNGFVESVTFNSREQAWENFKKDFAGKSEVIEGLDINPLPASFNLKFKEGADRLEHIRQFADSVRDTDGVESLDYGERWIGRFEKFMVFLRIFLLGIGGLLSLGLILIISNTIKLSILSRQDEVELMLLIGATPRFVKSPFLLEGMIQGVTGAGIALGILKGLQLYIEWQLHHTFESAVHAMEIQFLTPPFIAGLVGLSVLVAVVGSFIAIQQFIYPEAK